MNRLLQHRCLRFVLVDDHSPALLSGTGGVGLLVLIRRLGERHQDRGGSAHRQFTQTAGAGTAHRQVGMLQQARDLVAEGLLHQQRVLHLAHFGVVAAGEVHHTAALLEQWRQHSPHHAIQPHGPLAAADYHQQWTPAFRHPCRTRLALQKISPHRHARHQRSAAGYASGGRR